MSTKLRLVRPDKKYMKAYIQAIIDIDPTIKRDDEFFRDIEEEIKGYRKNKKDRSMWWLMCGEAYVGDFNFSLGLVEEIMNQIHWDTHLPNPDNLKLDRKALEMGLELIQRKILKEYVKKMKSGEGIVLTD